MPSAGFEPAIPAIERPQTCTSDPTGIGIIKYTASVKIRKQSYPCETWTGPEISRRLRLPDFMTLGTRRW